jgi:hypothetical protein
MNSVSDSSNLQSTSLGSTPAASTMLIAAATFSVAAVTLWLAFFDSARLF